MILLDCISCKPCEACVNLDTVVNIGTFSVALALMSAARTRDGHACTGAPKVVAYHVIEVEYDTVSGKLQHVGRLHKPHQYDCLARDKKSYAPSKNSPLV